MSFEQDMRAMIADAAGFFATSVDTLERIPGTRKQLSLTETRHLPTSSQRKGSV